MLVCAACIPKVSRKDGAEFAGDVYRCPGAPFRVLRKFEGTFASVTSFGKYGGDLCVTVLTGPLQHVKHANVQCSREKQDAGLAHARSYRVLAATNAAALRGLPAPLREPFFGRGPWRKAGTDYICVAFLLPVLERDEPTDVWFMRRSAFIFLPHGVISGPKGVFCHRPRLRRRG